ANWGKLSICLLAAVQSSGAFAADAEAAGSSAAPAAEVVYDVPPSAFEIGREALLAKDYATAHRSLRTAAEQGDVLAQAALGDMYLAGQGVDVDNAEALRWYRSAAKLGDAKAQAGLGRMYADGRGVPREDETAIKWFRLAAENEETAAQSG